MKFLRGWGYNELRIAQKQLREILKPILRKEEILMAYLFGFGKEDGIWFDSDMDMAICPKDLSKSEKLIADLQKEIIKKTKAKWADILLLNASGRYWRYLGVNGISLYSHGEEFRAEFETRVRMDDWDWEYYENYYHVCFRKKIK